jgi:hypothetical protein
MSRYLEKNPSQKRTDGVAQGVGPEFKPQYLKKKKKKVTTERNWTKYTRDSPLYYLFQLHVNLQLS